MSEQIVPQLLPIEKNNESRQLDILTNIVKMLTERGLLNKKSNLDQYVRQVVAGQTDEQTYKIDLDNYEKVYGPNNGTLLVRLVKQKITSISKSSAIADLMTNYKMSPKIIVVSSISVKTRYQVQSDNVTYPYTEIFLEKELLINIIDHVSQPKFVLLTDEEAQEVVNSYHIKKREIAKILVTDPIVYYYNAKPGQIFRIIRPSETSVEAFSYRLVIKGQIKES
jgi:DNA-directed RNA polymerase subunit H (RpoH/RPB5)